jgi:hypothetical protein
MTSITVTGLDERTNLADAFRLVAPDVEFGILVSLTPEGRHRYPSLLWVLQAATALREHAAIHVCGSNARREALAGNLDPILTKVRRIQVNGTVSADELALFLRRFPSQVIITQHQPANASLMNIVDDTGRHAVLVDASGGRGISPDEWQRPAGAKPVGFAGGLGPDNLADEIPRIAAVAHGHWWVDMEGKLRDDGDWFDLARARAAIDAFRRVTPVAA